MLLDDAAGVHHEDAVAERRDEAEVVADEDQAHAALGDEAVEDAEHLELDGNVERRGRLVGDQEVGLGDQHHRDHRALAHAAGELVRVGVEDAGGIADLHRGEHGEDALAQLAARRPGSGRGRPRRSAGRPASPG